MKTPTKGNLFVLPSLILLGVITLYPAVYVIYLSLQRRLLIFNLSRFIGLDNYLFLWRDNRFWNALGNTLYFAVVSVCLELIIGLGFALLLHRTFRLKGVLRAVVMIPWIIPTVVSAKIWEWIYNTDFGVLNYLLGLKVNWLGNPFWALNCAVAMDIWKTTPFVAILLTAGLQLIPVDVVQAAKMDGAGAWQIFKRITFPLLKPVILVVLIFRTLDAFRVFDAVYVLTGGGPANATETLSIYAYKVLFQMLQFGYGSAISVVVFVCVGFFSLMYLHLLRKGGI